MLRNAELDGGCEGAGANPEPQERCGLAGNTIRFVQAELGSDEIDTVNNRGLWPE